MNGADMLGVDMLGVDILGVDINIRKWDNYDLAEDAKIDKYALDVEAEKQAELMVKWLGLLNQAQVVLTKMKEKLANVEAELRIEAKTNGIMGVGKVTESAIDSWIQTHPSRVAAYEDYSAAYSSVQYLQNAKAVLDHKKSMIQVLDHLLVAGYYAKPDVSAKASENGEKELEEKTKKQLDESLRRKI